jgi:hypothetical protein
VFVEVVHGQIHREAAAGWVEGNVSRICKAHYYISSLMSATSAYIIIVHDHHGHCSEVDMMKKAMLLFHCIIE